MTYKLLFILLEGNDDERFFDKVFKPLFEKRSRIIKFWKYSQQQQKRTLNLIRSIESMNGDYIYVTDLNDAPCTTAKKEGIKSELGQRMKEDNIIVVIREIEGWYLAGLDESTSKKLGMSKNMVSTDRLTKEEFNQLVPKSISRIEFMQKILKNYGVEIAKGKNTSFGYFLNKWINDSIGV